MKIGYQVADVMTTTPVTVPPDMMLSEAAKIMREHHVNSILIAEQELVKGIVTDQDIVRKVVAEAVDPTRTPMSKIMESELVTIKPQDDLYQAMLIMREYEIRHLPVVDEGKFLGFITLKDILKIEPELFEIMIEKYQIRSNRVKSVRKSIQAITDGICEECGDFSVQLQNIDDKFMCNKCVHELVEQN
jgi:CBS domain-containing protein